jgi:hypothetical protein
VLGALGALRDRGLTEEARAAAGSALVALGGRPPPALPAPGEGRHVMVSYQWAVQRTVRRLVAALQRRTYAIWFDLGPRPPGVLKRPLRSPSVKRVSTALLYGRAGHSAAESGRLRARAECMKGSTMDAMSEAVDRAAVVLYGVRAKGLCFCGHSGRASTAVAHEEPGRGRSARPTRSPGTAGWRAPYYFKSPASPRLIPPVT